MICAKFAREITNRFRQKNNCDNLSSQSLESFINLMSAEIHKASSKGLGSIQIKKILKQGENKPTRHQILELIKILREQGYFVSGMDGEKLRLSQLAEVFVSWE